MKHLHMLMAFLTLGLFLYQVSFVLRGQKISVSRSFKGISHIIYLMLVGSGLYLFWQLSQIAGVQHWTLAKMVLLVVAVSANIKAMRPSITLGQSKAGMLLAFIAYAGVLMLAITKPTLMS